MSEMIERITKRRYWDGFWLGMGIGIAIGATIISTSARAECLQWGQTLTGDRVCMVNDAVNRNPIVRIIPAPNEPTTSGVPRPTCEEGWTLVADFAMQPMCALELKKPR